MLLVLPQQFRTGHAAKIRNWGGKTSNIGIQLVRQQCCRTSCTILLLANLTNLTADHFWLAKSVDTPFLIKQCIVALMGSLTTLCHAEELITMCIQNTLISWHAHRGEGVSMISADPADQLKAL